MICFVFRQFYQYRYFIGEETKVWFLSNFSVGFRIVRFIPSTFPEVKDRVSLFLTNVGEIVKHTSQKEMLVVIPQDYLPYHSYTFRQLVSLTRQGLASLVTDPLHGNSNPLQTSSIFLIPLYIVILNIFYSFIQNLQISSVVKCLRRSREHFTHWKSGNSE